MATGTLFGFRCVGDNEITQQTRVIIDTSIGQFSDLWDYSIEEYDRYGGDTCIGRRYKTNISTWCRDNDISMEYYNQSPSVYTKCWE